jgi:hypothetical protein
VRTNNRSKKGVVFSLSIAGFVTELRLSGDAMLMLRKAELLKRRFAGEIQSRKLGSGFI